MRRREFLGVVCGAVAWPAMARAQPSVPVIGYLASSSAAAPSGPIEGVYLGLKQAGFEIDRNVKIEHRYADNRQDRLTTLAAELVNIPASLIITSGGPSPTLAAKAATSTIPIVFGPVSDPVRTGVVASLNKPGGNVTGIAGLTIELDPKRIEVLHELTPKKGALGVLFNPTRADSAIQVDSIQATARSVGRELVLAGASTTQEIDSAFAKLRQADIAGLLVAADAFFSGQRALVVDLVGRHRWPAVYQWREFAEAGGLSSFGSNLFDSYRQVGLFAARILKGEKPADLPVQQPTKFELVINLRTARSIALDVPLALIARADEVIE